MHAARAARGLWTSVERGARGALSAWLLASLAWSMRMAGAGIARGWDMVWQWGASLLPDKVGEASVARSLLSTMGWQWCSRPAHH